MKRKHSLDRHRQLTDVVFDVDVDSSVWKISWIFRQFVVRLGLIRARPDLVGAILNLRYPLITHIALGS